MANLNQNFQFIDVMQSNFIQNEACYADLRSFNKDLNKKDSLILYVNIRSLNANFNKLEIFIKRLKIKPYVIVCSESWNLELPDHFKLPGYKLYYNNSKINKADGVVVYISDNVNEISDIIEVGRLKILHTCIKLNNNSTLEISSIYRSHDFYCSEFIINLKSFLLTKRKTKNHLVIGDFNIDITRNNLLNQEFLNNLLDSGYYPAFLGITRPNDNTGNGTCIDNIFIKNRNIKSKALKITIPMPDHYPLFVLIDKPQQAENNDSKQFCNYNKLKRLAGTIDWNSIKAINDPNLATDHMIRKIQTCIDCSNYKVNTNGRKANKLPRKVWITKAIIISCERKENLYKLTKTNPQCKEIKTEYNTYSKILNKVIKDAKIKYEKNLIKMNSNNPRKLWNFISTKLGKNRKNLNSDINQLLDTNNKIITEPLQKANHLNNYFCGVGKNLYSKIKMPANKKLKLPNQNPNSIFINPTDKYEIINIINDMGMKNGGVDKINSKVLKCISHHITDALAHLFNLCIEKTVWPNALKSAEIVPIYKSGSKNEISNYRPISLVSNLAKIFEKIIYNRFYAFINKNNLLAVKQFGFIKNKGTKDALNDITTKIYENLDKSKPIAVTFLDLAKAFDTVDHKILLDKLYNYGIRGKAYKLIQSYLDNRTQKVRLGRCFSDEGQINSGVPQGTILGPLFFILYVNDLLTTMPEHTILSYADDTAIISTGNSWNEVQVGMNNYLKIVADWLALNKLSLNVDKTIYITFGIYYDSVPANFDIFIDKRKLKRVESCRYLGIIFDCNLKWDKHIDFIIKRTKYLIFVFYKLSQVMTGNTLKMIYFAFFHSIINYGIIAWGGAFKTEVRILQNLQTRILKIINKNSFDNNLPLNLKQLFDYESIVYNYNTLKNIFLNSESVTRNKSIQLPKYVKTISNKNNYINAIKLYNSLPNELKVLNISNKASKMKLKEWIRVITQ